MLSKTICLSLIAGSILGASLACAQPADPALANLNTCLSGPAGGTEEDFMKKLNPALNDPDRVAWCLFVYVNNQASSAGNNNALFETWATDGDTFQATPAWPTSPSPLRSLRRPVLSHLGGQQPQGTLTPFVLPFSSTQCTPGQLCVGEEVRRNRPTYDFIVKNKLFSRDGLRAFTQTITFPADSIEVKANWVPVSQLSQFLQNNGAPANPALYHVNTTTENGQQVQYALVAMHVISKMVPNWTWATFEHVNNPGRCDVIGCVDSFGATPGITPPRNPPFAGVNSNTWYQSCTKTPALTAVFGANKIDPAFANYCLKGSQVDFTDATGVSTRLGNSVTEAGFVDTASCISCHGRAAYSFVTGAWASNRVFLYNSTPIAPIGPLDPGQFWQYPQQDPMRPKDAALFRASDFVWSIPFCAISSDPTVKPPCADK